MKIPKFIYSKELTYKKEILYILGCKLSFPRKNKTIAFLETRGLGDYILMHNFFKFLKESRKYKDYNIILVTRKNFLSLAEAYDSLYVDEILCVDTRKAAAALKNLQVEELICLHNGKEKFEQIWFRKIKAKKKKLCNVEADSTKFRSHALKRIFEELIEENIEDFGYPYFNNTVEQIRNNSIFISPFAGSALRCWSLENYAELINKITEDYPNDIVILGEHPNRQDIDRLISMCNVKERIINTAGRFSVNALYDILCRKACLLIANETGTVHLAMCANINTVCISNGSLYGVFLPYNKNNIKYVFPRNFDYKFTPLSKYNINTIETDDVYSQVNYFLKSTDVNSRLTVNNV